MDDREVRVLRERLAEAASLIDDDPDAAERRYRGLVRDAPWLDVAWFDLGLIYKRRRDWPATFECNRRAADLLGAQPGEPAWWNLGIAATALGDWDTARRAWRAYGVDLPSGAGPIEADLGLAPVRLNPDGDAEVVWGHRVDPARVVLVSIPFPSSGHRWGDYVLHDGAPNGEREWRGRTYPVFDELERWRPSDVPTVRADVDVAGPADVDELAGAVRAAGAAFEDWSASVRFLCQACSEGRVGEHDHPAPDDPRRRHVGLAGHLADLLPVLEAWAAAAPGRAFDLLSS